MKGKSKQLGLVLAYAVKAILYFLVIRVIIFLACEPTDAVRFISFLFSIVVVWLLWSDVKGIYQKLKRKFGKHKTKL